MLFLPELLGRALPLLAPPSLNCFVAELFVCGEVGDFLELLAAESDLVENTLLKFMGGRNSESKEPQSAIVLAFVSICTSN